MDVLSERNVHPKHKIIPTNNIRAYSDWIFETERKEGLNKIIKNGEIWESNLEFWVGAIPSPTQPSAPTKSLREWRVFKPLPPPLNS